MRNGFSVNYPLAGAFIAIALASMVFVFNNPHAVIDFGVGFDGIHFQIDGGQGQQRQLPPSIGEEEV